jgi:hypothetical protein
VRIISIANMLLFIKNIIAMPMAIQNNIKPIIRFIVAISIPVLPFEGE